MSKHLKIRFRHFPQDISRQVLKRLFELVYSCDFTEVEDENIRVELEITGPYSGGSDSFETPFATRAARGILSKTSYGQHLSVRKFATGITPNPKAKVNIWYTGENERPPYGNWDAFLSFDTKFTSNRNIYFPLWFITSTNLIMSLEKSYWGREHPTLSELYSRRRYTPSKKKFACAFFGKNYRFRLHALEALREIGEVDVFGQGARRPVETPSRIAENYKFTLCFENDLYPGYVTEKPIEAYLAGTIPIYMGMDSERYLNSKAILNLNDFDSASTWLMRIQELQNNIDSYGKVFSEPLLIKRPDLDDIIRSLRRILFDG